jgi:hypothetical protein
VAAEQQLEKLGVSRQAVAEREEPLELQDASRRAAVEREELPEPLEV